MPKTLQKTEKQEKIATKQKHVRDIFLQKTLKKTLRGVRAVRGAIVRAARFSYWKRGNIW